MSSHDPGTRYQVTSLGTECTQSGASDDEVEKRLFIPPIIASTVAVADPAMNIAIVGAMIGCFCHVLLLSIQRMRFTRAGGSLEFPVSGLATVQTIHLRFWIYAEINPLHSLGKARKFTEFPDAVREVCDVSRPPSSRPTTATAEGRPTMSAMFMSPQFVMARTSIRGRAPCPRSPLLFGARL